MKEASGIVYPIRYDTREEIERLVRQQSEGSIDTGLGSVITGSSPRGTTPTTFPGGNMPAPRGRTSGWTGPIGGPLPPIMGSPGRSDPNDPLPDDRDHNSRFPDERDDLTSPRRRRDDVLSLTLDRLYRDADAYLNDLAAKSGGRLSRADTLVSLPAAFAQIAAKLRTQYSLGYYPSKTTRDGEYRQIKVQTSRKGVVIRARPGLSCT